MRHKRETLVLSLSLKFFKSIYLSSFITNGLVYCIKEVKQIENYTFVDFLLFLCEWVSLGAPGAADAIATADKFLALIQERLTRIEELVETNLDAVENLAGAIESLENAKKALSDAGQAE